MSDFKLVTVSILKQCKTIFDFEISVKDIKSSGAKNIKLKKDVTDLLKYEATCDFPINDLQFIRNNLVKKDFKITYQSANKVRQGGRK